MSHRSKWRSTLLFASLLFAGAAHGQESRGTISGTVMDPQSAVIPGAAVVVTNQETKVESRTVTNSTGFFEVPLLNPGRYSVSVEAPGFKKIVQSGLELNVGGRIALQLRMEVGQVAETVEVTAEAPLLDTTSASGGRLVGPREVTDLPVNSMNPFLLVALAAGMQWTGAPQVMNRAFDVGATSSYNTAGGVGQNEFAIDGAPVTGTNRRAGYVPPLDSVGEFRLETTSFDASVGRTSGAVVNVSSKSGTNTLHGSLFDQHWQQRWNATPHFTRLAYEAQVAAGTKSPNDPKQVSGRSNNYGGSIGGPIYLPKIYDGRNKAFFFASYNGYAIDTGGTSFRSVPQEAWLNGDFSGIQAIDPVLYTIYDPRSARQEGSRVVRTPFPGNKGIPILSPVYNAYVKMYPKPTNTPGIVTKEGMNNHFDPSVGQKDRFQSIMNRYDYTVSDTQRTYFKWYYTRRQDYTGDWTKDTVPGLHDGGGYRVNKGGSLNYLWTISNVDLVDFGVNITRFIEGLRIPVQTSFKPSDVGFPKYIDERAVPYTNLPRIDFAVLQDFSREYASPSNRGMGTTFEIKAAFSSVRGAHSLKYGFSERRYWFPIEAPNYPSGSYTFNNTYLRSRDNDNTASNYGLDFAAFMMGTPGSITIDKNDTAFWTTRYRALYLQDEWRLTRRLTLNLGLRYEREGGITERYNRGLAGQFIADAKLPITDLVQAAYASSPLAELPASAFRVLGGVPYLGESGRKSYTAGTHKLLPRFGFAYQLNDKTVLRGGYGWYYDTFNSHNTRPSQLGYSQPTNTTVSNDLGLSFCCGVGAASNLSTSKTPMHDPFPVRADGTRFDDPVGNRLGLMRIVGQNYTAYPWEFSPDWQQRVRFGVQRQLPANFVVEVAYTGSFARIWAPGRINYLPEQYWAKGNVRNQAVDNDMNLNVTNPFRITNLASLKDSNPLLYNFLSTQSLFTSSTIRKNVLLRSVPHMGTLTGLRPGQSFEDARGRNEYHDFQIQLERRFSKGLQMAVLYTRVGHWVQNTYMNEFDPAPMWLPSDNTRPNRFVWSGIYEFPFGKNRKWLNSGPVQHLVGGWQVSWIYQYQDGPPTTWANRFFYGDLSRLSEIAKHDQVHSADIHVWFDPAIAYKGTGSIPADFVGFEGRSANQPGSFHARVFPPMTDAIRSDGIRNWDVKLQRTIPITERWRGILSLEALNATNHTNFNPPVTDPTNSNFGKVTSQLGSSRVLQFNLRVEF